MWYLPTLSGGEERVEGFVLDWCCRLNTELFKAKTVRILSRDGTLVDSRNRENVGFRNSLRVRIGCAMRHSSVGIGHCMAIGDMFLRPGPIIMAVDGGDFEVCESS
jgi:hypothetical protein